MGKVHIKTNLAYDSRDSGCSDSGFYLDAADTW